MDTGRIVTVATTLLDSLGDRLADRQNSFRRLLWAGEEGIAVDMLVGELVHRELALTAAERDLTRELLTAYEGLDLDSKIYPVISDPQAWLAALKSVEEP